MELRVEKYVSSLPGTLQANTVYYVKSGSGFDTYITNNSGTVVAYPLNAPAFSAISGKPTTLSGYGITDAYPLSGNPSGFLSSIGAGTVTNTMLAGSIADSKILSAATWNAKLSSLSGALLVDGSTPLTANWNAAAFSIESKQTAATAATVYDGFKLTNSTAATSGNQQYSPALIFEGQGWKTTATAASQTVKFRLYNRPVQGTANATALFNIDANINNAGYSNVFSLDGIGIINSAFRIVNPGGGVYTARFINPSGNYSLEFFNSTAYGNGPITANNGPFFVNCTCYGFATPVIFGVATGTNSPFVVTNTGSVGIGSGSPVASAALEIVSTTRGVLLPRMTTTQKMQSVHLLKG